MHRTRRRVETGSAVHGPALVYGFGSAIAMWCVALVTNAPGVNASHSLSAALMLSVMFTGGVMAGVATGLSRGWIVALLSGMVAGFLNILVIASALVSPSSENAPAAGFSGLGHDAAVRIPGFILLCCAVAFLGGLAGSFFRGDAPEVIVHTRIDWLSRFARVTVAAFVPLILLGGAVTSTGSGMAVPDWPTTYSANMFLYPLALMTDPKIFLEHTHRLFGSLVGLTTFTMMIYTLAAEQRRRVRIFAVAIFLLVAVQGVLGGERVRMSKTTLALVHGVSGQILLCLSVMLAAYVSPSYRQLPKHPIVPNARRCKMLATALFHSALLQLLLGATYRHLHHTHVLWTHAAFSIVVVLAAAAVGFAFQAAVGTSARAGQASGTLRWTGRALLVTVLLQFLLGWGAFFAVRGQEASREISWNAAIATAHQGNGALLLSLAGLAFVWARRLVPREGGH